MSYFIPNTTNTLKLAALAAATMLALSACSQGGDDASAEQGTEQEAPAPVVGVVTVQPQNITLSTELPGRLESRRIADILPQVGGIIKKRLFQEGSYVRAGQPLYQIDDAVYTTALENARAQLASAQSELAKANADLSRYKPLVEADAISKQEYDAAVAAKRSADASVKAARAGINAAQINVNYSRITAPISGYIGQSFVSEGTLVSPGGPSKLATIQQTDPMYVNVTQSAAEVMQLRQDIADGKMQAVNGGIEIDIKLENGTIYPRKGRLLFADPTVDQTTGQVTLRAEVPNPDNILLPGLYVRVVLPQADIPNAFAVPQQAVTRGESNTVMIVTAENTLEPRQVNVIQQQGNNWIISDGLQAGDKVVVNGLSIVGMSGAKKVTPKEWTAPNSTASAPADVSNTASDAETTSADQAASAAQ
ncbi:efflux RND transporter periplasmic adaptor subunit [Neisseria montereyensis]|uniref:Efflux RND transporter periplasmic adaptor subunit n=1 Tax=Neisseria montereyensis TaxID=2973938 RepID=A0ABT2FAH7_9NEIS|nr:efflux RND transporter periplasmic adaptor subunit [Neisseria montereyensis]MCS4533226.1 efflux RND transporter periplasmic adaptor subunit [Neisseria montereyensis]